MNDFDELYVVSDLHMGGRPGLQISKERSRNEAFSSLGSADVEMVRRMEALGSLAELYLLLLAHPEETALASWDETRKKSEAFIRLRSSHLMPDSFQIGSTRQLERYRNWWWSAELATTRAEADEAQRTRMRDAVEALLALFVEPRGIFRKDVSRL